MLELLSSPVIQNGIMELVVAFAVLVALPFIAKRLNITIDDKTRTYVETAIRGAVKYAFQQVAEREGKSVRNVALKALNAEQNGPLADGGQFINEASRYLVTTVPGGLKRLGMHDLADVQQVVKSRAIDVALELTNDNKA